MKKSKLNNEDQYIVLKNWDTNLSNTFGKYDKSLILVIDNYDMKYGVNVQSRQPPGGLTNVDMEIIAFIERFGVVNENLISMFFHYNPNVNLELILERLPVYLRLGYIFKFNLIDSTESRTVMNLYTSKQHWTDIIEPQCYKNIQEGIQQNQLINSILNYMNISFIIMMYSSSPLIEEIKFKRNKAKECIMKIKDQVNICYMLYDRNNFKEFERRYSENITQHQNVIVVVDYIDDSKKIVDKINIDISKQMNFISLTQFCMPDIELEFFRMYKGIVNEHFYVKYNIKSSLIIKRINTGFIDYSHCQLSPLIC